MSEQPLGTAAIMAEHPKEMCDWCSYDSEADKWTCRIEDLLREHIATRAALDTSNAALVSEVDRSVAERSRLAAALAAAQELREDYRRTGDTARFLHRLDQVLAGGVA